MNRLRHIRKAKKLTLAQVAERAGTTADQISKLERGERGLDTVWMERLANALDLRGPAELIEEPQPQGEPIDEEARIEGYLIFRQIIKKRPDLTPKQEARFLESIQRIVSKEIAAHGQATLSLVAAENILEALLREHAASKGGTP